MPADPTLPTTIVAGTTTGHAAATVTVHTLLNGIYKAVIQTAKTGNYTLVQADQASLIPANSASPVTFTVPSLAAGTMVEILRQGTGAVNLSASGVTLLIPPGSTATPRVQYSTINLLWLTTTTVLVGGDLT